MRATHWIWKHENGFIEMNSKTFIFILSKVKRWPQTVFVFSVAKLCFNWTVNKITNLCNQIFVRQRVINDATFHWVNPFLLKYSSHVAGISKWGLSKQEFSSFFVTLVCFNMTLISSGHFYFARIWLSEVGYYKR